MEMWKPTESDWDKLPQITMTSDMPWNPADCDEERDICDFFDGDESVTATSVAFNDTDSYFDPVADDDHGEPFDPHELNGCKCMRHVSRKVHFDLQDSDADDMPQLVPQTCNAILKFVDEFEKEKRFF